MQRLTLPGLSLLSLASLALAADPSTPAPPLSAAPGVAPNPADVSTTLLPDDPARTLVIRACVVCHPVELVVSKKRTIEAWDKLISKMVDYGAKADDDQQLQILTYFVTHFKGTDTSTGAPVSPVSTR